MESNRLSEDSELPSDQFFEKGRVDIGLSQKEGSNREKQQEWRKPSDLGEEEKIAIFERSFQLQAEGKISLKKYYESTDPYSLFQFKGYSVKYESIRRTTLYQKLKP